MKGYEGCGRQRRNVPTGNRGHGPRADHRQMPMGIRLQALTRNNTSRATRLLSKIIPTISTRDGYQLGDGALGEPRGSHAWQ